MQDYRSDVFYVSEACTDPEHAFCRVWTPCTWDGPIGQGKHLTTAEQLCNLKLSNWKEIPLLPPEPAHVDWVRVEWVKAEPPTIILDDLEADI